MPIVNYYDILGVHPEATESEIKKAYKKQAHKHHPDKGGDKDKFVLVKKAYDVLTSVQDRYIHNLSILDNIIQKSVKIKSGVHTYVYPNPEKTGTGLVSNPLKGENHKKIIYGKYIIVI